MQDIISQQEDEILFLQSKIDSSTETIDTTNLEKDLKDELELLEEDTTKHLNYFNDVCPVVGLLNVQAFSKLDEEIYAQITNYTKLIDFTLDAIDMSVYQQCLRSDRSQEFAELCHEKKKLEIFGIKCLKQEILAKAGYERFKHAMKSFEEKILNEDKIKKIDNISERIDFNKNEILMMNSEIYEMIEKIDKISIEINEINTEIIEFQNIDLVAKKNEFSNIKLQEIKNLVEQQKKNNLLGLSCIIIEQDEIQQEYDKLFQIQSLFEEISAQIEFRINAYRKFKLRAESLTEDRKTIDERDELLNNFILNISNQYSRPSTFQQLINIIECIVQQGKNTNQKIKVELENINKQCCSQLEICKEAIGILKSNQYTKDMFKEELNLANEISKIDEKLQQSLKKFENMNKAILMSLSGISEREIFVQYFISENPSFFKECDNL